MNMTVNEIERNYRQAKNKKEQLAILADLNVCSVEEIKAVLIGTGKYTDRGGNGLYLASIQARHTESDVADWKTAIAVLNTAITQLTNTRDKADSELSEIMLALAKIGSDEKNDSQTEQS